MNLSQLAVRRPITISVGVILVLLFGALSFTNLGLDLFPDWQLPYVTIATVYPAADPQTVEEEVTRLIEGMVSTVSGLRRVQSTSMENMSIVTAEFGWGTPIEQTLEEIRGQVSALGLLLPAEAHPPFVTSIDPSQLPVMILGVTSSEGVEHTTNTALNVVVPALEQVPGVGQVTMLGGVEREIQVLYHSDKLEEHDLTPAILQQLLSLQNALVPAGVVESDGTRFHARIGNHFANVQEIGDLVIGESRLPVQGLAALWPPLLYVKDVADVVDGFKPAAGSARIAGEDTILLQVMKRPGANTVQVTHGLKQAMEHVAATAPTVNIGVIIDQSVQIVSSLSNLALFGSFGALLAVAVLFLFLRSWRSILVIATAIPLSIVVTIALLYFTDLSLNLMTLGGLSLGIGMLVDNSIIVLESIFRHRSLGADPKEAAVAGAKEVSAAVVAATLTTVVVFLPVLFMDTFAARLFRDLGLTVSLSLFASLVVSLTVIPAMAGSLLRGEIGSKETGEAGYEDERRPSSPDVTAGTSSVSLPVPVQAAATDGGGLGGRLGDLYAKALGRVLDNKAVVVVSVVLIVVLSATLWPRLGIQFLPDSPTRAMYVSMETAPGTPLAESQAVADEAESRLMALGEFQFVTVQVGEQHQQDLISILSDHGPTSIKLIAVGHKPFYGRHMYDTIDATRRVLADLPVEFVSVSNAWESDANLFSGDVLLQVRGPRFDDLERVAEQLHAHLKNDPAVAEAHISLADRQPEVFLAVDQSRALIGGLTTGQISLAVRHALTGVQATQVRRDGHTIPVVLRPHPDEVATLDDLLNFRVSSPVVTGMDDGSVRLGNVVNVKETTSPQTIRHVDGARVVEVRVKPAGNDVRQLSLAIDNALGAIQLPEGVAVREAGVTEQIDESMGELALALVFALALVYLVMVAQFESWRDPIIIMATTPLAAVGVLWALWATNTSVSIMPLLGLIILGGIVVNNGILLVDYMGQLRRQGMDLHQAIIVGARTRLRPVLMTATTTIGGMLPLAVSQGEGMEMQGPLAVTVIGGLLVATLLTLFVVPTLYAVLHRPRAARRDKRTGRRGLSAPVVWLLAGTLAGFIASTGTPVAAQENAAGLAALSRPSLAAGFGYDVGDARLVYMAGAGWRAYVGDVDWTVYAGAAVGEGKPSTWLLGAQGNWFQPISFAGYYELDGELSVRHVAGHDPAAAFSLTADAVLGNITLLVEYDSVGAGFPRLPWDVPGRLPTLPEAPAMRKLRGELRQQPHRELNLVREFQWADRSDRAGVSGSLLVMTGAEVRAGRGWLVGKLGLHVDESRWQPMAEVGVRLRPGPTSSFELRLSSATVWEPVPMFSAVYDTMTAQRIYNVRLSVQPDDSGPLLPTFVFQSGPRRSGVRWQLAFETSEAARAASFGIFTTF